MPSLNVKNIPDHLYKQLKINAATNQRSLNREILACMEQALSSQKVNPEQMLVRARMLREKTAAYRLTNELLNEAKNEGRP